MATSLKLESDRGRTLLLLTSDQLLERTHSHGQQIIVEENRHIKANTREENEGNQQQSQMQTIFTASGTIHGGSGEPATLGIGTGTQQGLAGVVHHLGTSLGTQNIGVATLHGTGSAHLHTGFVGSVHSHMGTLTSGSQMGSLAGDLQTVRVQLLLLKDKMGETQDLPSHLKQEYKLAIFEIVEIVNSAYGKEQQMRRAFDQILVEETNKVRDDVARAVRAKEAELDEMKSKVLSFSRQIQSKYTLQSQLCDDALKSMVSHLRNKKTDELKSNIKEFLKTQVEHRHMRYRLQSQLSSVRKPVLESERRRELGDFSACQESKGDELQLLNCLDANRVSFDQQYRFKDFGNPGAGHQNPFPQSYGLETPKASDRYTNKLAGQEGSRIPYNQFVSPVKEQENMLTFKQGQEILSLGTKEQYGRRVEEKRNPDGRILRDLERSPAGKGSTAEAKSSAKKKTFTSEEYDMPDFTINSIHKKDLQIDSARIADKFDFSESRARPMQEADVEDVMGARSLPISLKGSSTFQ